MAKLTQRQIILRYLQNNQNQWFFAYELRGRSTPFGFCGHQADRRCRELAEEGLILRDGEGKYVKYKSLEPKGHYIVHLLDGDKQIAIW